MLYGIENLLGQVLETSPGKQNRVITSRGEAALIIKLYALPRLETTAEVQPQ